MASREGQFGILASLRDTMSAKCWMVWSWRRSSKWDSPELLTNNICYKNRLPLPVKIAVGQMFANDGEKRTRVWVLRASVWKFSRLRAKNLSLMYRYSKERMVSTFSTVHSCALKPTDDKAKRTRRNLPIQCTIVLVNCRTTRRRELLKIDVTSVR